MFNLDISSVSISSVSSIHTLGNVCLLEFFSLTSERLSREENGEEASEISAKTLPRANNTASYAGYVPKHYRLHREDNLNFLEAKC